MIFLKISGMLLLSDLVLSFEMNRRLEKVTDEECLKWHNGSCVHIANCKADLEEKIRGPVLPVCNDYSPIVCCPHTPKHLIPRKAILVCQEARILELFEQQGLSGGIETLVAEYPHMAALGYGEKNDTQWNCGGSLISNNFVLTAAHCLNHRQFGNVSFVRLGDFNLRKSDDGVSPQDFTVKQTYKHPLYRPPSKYHDIALIELDRSIRIDRDVRPECLQTTKYIGSNEWSATGWGHSSYLGRPTETLQKIYLKEFNKTRCDANYLSRQLEKGFTDDTQICAGGETQDICEGDSGGPLQKINNYSFQRFKKFTIIGVMSIGKPCGIVELNPNIFTRVSYYLDWIEQIVWPSIGDQPLAPIISVVQDEETENSFEFTALVSAVKYTPDITIQGDLNVTATEDRTGGNEKASNKTQNDPDGSVIVFKDDSDESDETKITRNDTSVFNTSNNTSDVTIQGDLNVTSTEEKTGGNETASNKTQNDPRTTRNDTSVFNTRNNTSDVTIQSDLNVTSTEERTVDNETVSNKTQNDPDVSDTVFTDDSDETETLCSNPWDVRCGQYSGQPLQGMTNTGGGQYLQQPPVHNPYFGQPIYYPARNTWVNPNLRQPNIYYPAGNTWVNPNLRQPNVYYPAGNTWVNPNFRHPTYYPAGNTNGNPNFIRPTYYDQYLRQSIYGPSNTWGRGDPYMRQPVLGRNQHMGERIYEAHNTWSGQYLGQPVLRPNPNWNSQHLVQKNMEYQYPTKGNPMGFNN